MHVHGYAHTWIHLEMHIIHVYLYIYIKREGKQMPYARYTTVGLMNYKHPVQDVFLQPNIKLI